MGHFLEFRIHKPCKLSHYSAFLHCVTAPLNLNLGLLRLRRLLQQGTRQCLNALRRMVPLLVLLGPSGITLQDIQGALKNDEEEKEAVGIVDTSPKPAE